MFEQIFKNVDDVLWKDAGCGSELDYVEQTSWILFLKYIDDLEKEKETSAQLAGKNYVRIIVPEFQWNVWAVPKDKDGKLDHHKALTGDDLIDFVNHQLFPYLKKFKISAENADTIQYKIGEIFSELKNRIQSGYALREAINLIDQLRFGSHAEKHEMSHLYEAKIQNMGNAGRNGGEYYTPRPLIKTIVKVVDPKIGNKIYDGAVGSAGFLCEAFEYLKKSKDLSTKDVEILQKHTFYGKEKKSLAYIIGIMNMIFHGIGSPNIIHTNTLTENITDIQEKDRYDIVIANPPFGGKERAEVQQNFPIKTSETAFLFLQHFIKILRANGKAGVVIKNTFLSNTDNASVSLRRHLLENCNLHTILDMPSGTFFGAGVPTVVLFFTKGISTKKIWYYQLNLNRKLGKTEPLNEEDLSEFVNSFKSKPESENSWFISISDINTNTYDLSVKNPSKNKKSTIDNPEIIFDKILQLNDESSLFLKKINDNRNLFLVPEMEWENKKVKDVLKLEYGKGLEKDKRSNDGKYPVYGANGEKTRSDVYYYENPSIIVGRKGSAGEVNLVEGKFWPLDVTYYVTIDTKKYDLKFIYYLLKRLNLPSLATGVKPGINRNNVYDIDVIVPKKLEDQRVIVNMLSELKTFELESIYKENLENINKLKQSILQKAFKGELSMKVSE
jgi:type I restriction enzyme M protein